MKSKCEIAGYPLQILNDGDYVDAGMKLYSMQGDIMDIPDLKTKGNQFISYDCDTTQGQSGAPIQLVSKDKKGKLTYTTIGIHYSSGEQEENIGALINQYMFDSFIAPTIKQLEEQFYFYELELVPNFTEFTNLTEL